MSTASNTKEKAATKKVASKTATTKKAATTTKKATTAKSSTAKKPTTKKASSSTAKTSSAKKELTKKGTATKTSTAKSTGTTKKASTSKASSAKKTGAKLVYMECSKETYELSLDEVRAKINERTKLVALTHVSNVLGVTNNISEISKIAHSVGAVIVVDGAQAVPHIPVDVQVLDADFYAFSGHKLCGPTGCGVLYGKRELLEKMQPFLRGGEMIEYVTRESATWAELPEKFEAGTVNVGGAVGLASAIQYLQSIGMENIKEHDNKLALQLINGIKNIPHINIIGSKDATKHCGIVTFTIDGVHPHDIASVLDTERIAIRAGHHCAQVLGAYLELPSTARASLYFYNTSQEIERFLDALKNVRSWLGLKD